MNILITGGSSGLGRAIVEQLAATGQHTLFFTYNRHIDQANELASNYRGVTAIECDFTKQADVDKFVGNIASLDLDVLINNAYVGLPQGKHFHKTSSDEFLQSFTTNILPIISITQAAVTGFKKKKFGKIINVLTAALINLPPIGYSIYASNKAYLQQLSKTWNAEYAKFNITSNCISPEFMLTNLSREVDERVVEQLQANHPLHSILTPQEVAETVIYLVGVSQQVNGVNIVINAAQNIIK